MDVAGTFFAILMTILLALHDKSVSFHFAKNLDLDELHFFELTSDVCCHCHLNTWSWWASEVAYFLNSRKAN
jgi:hypothetical protein